MITLTTQPSTIVTAQRPINLVATSDKYAIINLTSVAITNNGSGKCRFTKTSHGLIEDDIVFVTGSIIAAYNVKHEITVVNANVFDSNIDYSINDTVSVERNNPNFQIKSELYHFNNTRNAITGVTDAGGGNIQVTTTTNHGYVASDIISIEDTASYDGAYTIVSIDTPTRFTVTATYVSSQTGNTRKGEVISTKVQRYGSDFTFDFSGAAKSLLSFEIPTLSGVLRIEQENDNCIVHFAVMFSEQHDNYSGVLTIFDTELGNKIQAVNACLQHEDTQNLTGYIITSVASTTLKFLTDSVRTLKYKGDEWIALPFIASTNNPVNVKTVSNPGAVAATSATSTVVGGYGIAMVKVRRGALTMEISLINSTPAQISETITINVITNCQDSKRFWFQGRKGSLDVVDIFGLEDKVNSSEKQGYYRQVENGFAINERGNTVIKSVAESQYQLYGQYIDENTAIWLEQMFSSPEVFLESSGNLIPINITDGNNRSVDKINPVQLVVNYQKSNKIEQL